MEKERSECGGWTLPALKEHHDQLIELVRDDILLFRKNVAEQFDEKSKAIDKSEDAQRDYNQRSNEFRGQLDDQAKTLMPRIEALSKFEDISQRLATRIKDADKMFDDLRKEIALLRENQRTSEGSKAGWRASGSLIIGVTGVIAVVITIATVIVTVSLFVSRATVSPPPTSVTVQPTVPVEVKNTDANKVPVKQ